MKRLMNSQRSDDLVFGVRWPGMALLVLLAISLCAGCAKKGGVVARPEGERTQVAVEVEKGMRATIAATPTLKALAEIEVTMSGGVRFIQAAIVIERPSNLRIDLMDDLADVLTKLGSDDGELWLYVADGGGLYMNESARRGLRRVTGLSLNASELISILSGTPLMSDESVVLKSWDGSSFMMSGGAFRLWADEGGNRLVGFERVSRRRGYRVDLGDYRRVRGAWFPYEIRVSVPRSRATLLIRYRDVTGGTPIKGDPFLPPGQ